MNPKALAAVAALALLILMSTSLSSIAHTPLETRISYQGRITRNGNSLDETCDFKLPSV